MKLRLPRLFEKARLARVSHDTFAVVHEFAEDIANNIKEGRGILLCGPPGVGKTYATAALTADMVERVAADHEFVTAPDFFQNIRQNEHDRDACDPYREQMWLNTYTSVPWLVVNDLGKEYVPAKGNEWTVYALGRVLRARTERKRSTFITTNMDGKTLSKTYGESITSLMAETMEVVRVGGEDRRLKKRTR